MGYFENYSEQEINQILKLSNSFKDFARKIGYSYSPSGNTISMLKKKLQNYDTSHFYNNTQIIKRNEDNIFIKNSTASQHTFRKWYLKGEYTDYKCSICGQEPFWQEQEMPLILDHINGINNDDRLENLRWVCPNCNSILPTTGSRNPRRKNVAKKYYCQDCGCEISKKSKRCVSCDAKFRTVPIEKMQITREELKNLIRTTPFTKIGEKFGMSDNAIRKWCDKFNLPRKKSDILKYSDEEWQKI